MQRALNLSHSVRVGNLEDVFWPYRASKSARYSSSVRLTSFLSLDSKKVRSCSKRARSKALAMASVFGAFVLDGLAVSIILMKMPAVCGRRNVIIPSTLPLRNPGSLDTLMMRKGVQQSRPGRPRHFQHKSRTALSSQSLFGVAIVLFGHLD